MASTVGGRGTAALLVAAALCSLAAVLLAGALGPPTFSTDSPLDQVRLGGGEVDPVTTVEDLPADGDGPPVTTTEGIPPEVVLSLVVVIVAGALLVRSVLRARQDDVAEAEQPAEEPDGEAATELVAVAEAARRGLGRLEDVSSSGTGDAVLACWVELEAAGARLGSGRAWTDTPTDFAVRLAAAVPGLDSDVLADLRRTYSRVRHGGAGGPGAVGPDDVRRARAALQHLLAVLDPHDPQGLPR